jgi:F0F1-type ATP synthase membrane subunit c/vacuolar-type H+-ATPase subunit K
LIVHAIIGFLFALVFREDLSERARSVILPLAGVLVGLTFAWSATAIGIISSKEFRRIMENSRTGIRGTANYFQLAILVVLASTILWSIAGLGPYKTFPFISLKVAKLATSTFLFAFTSFAVTECWSAINLTRLTLLSYNLVRGIEDREEVLNKSD